MKKFFLCLLFIISFSVCFAVSNDARYAYPYEPNLPKTTDIPGIYVLKPYVSFKETVEKSDIYTIVVKNKITKKVISEYDDVVYDGQGLSDHNFVVPEDYTFITKGCLQYIVKADSYEIEIHNNINDQTDSEKDLQLKTENTILIIICSFLAVLLFVLVAFLIIQNRKRNGSLQQKQVMQIQEEEKAKISREIHDTVVQDIRAIRLETEAIKTDDDFQKNKVIDDITQCIIKMRNICYELAPAELADFFDTASQEKAPSQIDLISIFENLCKQFTIKTNISCSVQIDKNSSYPKFDKDICTNLVRVFQEILNNVNKHSYATKVTVLIKIQKNDDDDVFTVFVIDDGKGCKIENLNAKKLKNHFGIRNMQERMKNIGGKINFFSSPNEGMKVVLKIKV